MVTPKNITAKCDFCDRQAVYDGKTIFGPWAYLCEEHRQKVGVQDERFITRLSNIDTSPKKRCSLCGVEKPLSEFYKYTDHNGTERYRNECKVCNLTARRLKYNK